MMIKVVDCTVSPTNAAGRVEGKEFEELVKSIKEKGMLQPVLARSKGKGYEVVAGNRRLEAARELRMADIPAHVVEMTDDEAMEAQVVENLQRKDVHPIDEGLAYRRLIENGRKIYDVAVKVGKSEKHVRGRLYLSNLSEKAAAIYRSDRIKDGCAVLIAELSQGDQDRAVKELLDRSWMGEKDLKEWINEEIRMNLDNQPWVGKKDLETAVGPCIECEPSRMTLFGAVKDGFCTDAKCWKRKMGKYIDHIAKGGLTKISTSYSEASKGILSRDSYVVVPKNGKDRCKSAQGAVVAYGDEIGKRLDICSDKNCQMHRSKQSHYVKSPQEKAAEQRAKNKHLAAVKAYEEVIAAAMKKVQWPMTEKMLDNLLEYAFYRCGNSFQQPVAARHGVKTVPGKNGGRDYEKGLREKFADQGNAGKLRLVFELLMPGAPNEWANGSDTPKIKKSFGLK